MEIKINGTINIETADSTPATTATTSTAEQPVVDHSKDVLISNDTTFAELLRVLASNPDTAISAQQEAEAREAEEKEAKLKEAFGEDYELLFDKKQQEDAEERTIEGKTKRRPGPIQLRNGYPRIAMIELGENALLEVFNNGYAVYDNGNRKVVLWVPDCGSVTYYFTGLRDNQKDYLPQKDEIGEDVMGQFPWYHALMVAGENRIEYNMDHPKSKGNTSDFGLEEDVKPAYHWAGGYHFDTPEEAYLKKEAAEERKKALTEKQREVYIMRYELGMTEKEIAFACNAARRTIRNRLSLIKNKLEANPEKFF